MKIAFHGAARTVTGSKHLISLKQLQDQLNAFHISQVPYAFPWESMSTLLGLNFAPAVGYLASKIYTGDTAGPKLISFLFTSLWGLSEWVNYSYRKAKLAQIDELLKFLENKKKEFE